MNFLQSINLDQHLLHKQQKSESGCRLASKLPQHKPLRMSDMPQNDLGKWQLKLLRYSQRRKLYTKPN